MIKRIALCGPPGSGKSSISWEWAVKLHGGHRISFADEVRNELAAALAYVDVLNTPPYMDLDADEIRLVHLERMENPDTKEVYRPLMQVYATEYRRAQDPDYWIKTVGLRLSAIEQFMGDPYIAVDDCRFPNEYEMLRRRGFKFVLLETPFSAESSHESEQHWPLFDFDYVLEYQRGPIAQAHALEEMLNG